MTRLTLYQGDVVSTGYAFGVVIKGRVIQLLRRRDNTPFVMVEVTDHPDTSRIGERMWEDGWELGAGELQGTCERCHRPFRYEPGAVGHTCRRCWGEDAAEAQAAEPSRRATGFEHRLNTRRMRDAS